MKTLISLEHKDKADKEIIIEIEKAFGGYRKDREGREFYYEADGDILKQVFCDKNEVAEWSISQQKTGAYGAKLEVELEYINSFSY